MNITIKCPQCGKELTVNSAAGLEACKAECPGCHTTRTISEYLPKLSFRLDDGVYQLKFGKQWVGRKSEGSTADVQMPDRTRYMSKKHALVEISCTAAGLQCTFEEHGKNPTSLQGIELMNEDIVYLNPNDCLQMGDRKMFLSKEYENKDK